MVRLRSPSTPSSVEGLMLLSYAKLNLYLEVLNKRQDNYHNIKTVFERISLCDKIILKPRPDKLIRIICKDSDVPQDKANLCYASAKLLQGRFNINTGLDIRILKRIPVGSGLGGGSSNAAGVLSGLNKLWRLNLSRKRLLGFAGAIGSDVPFFVYNMPFAYGCGRGDRIKPLGALKHLCLWHILVVPRIKVSTPAIYKRWDTHSRLTPHLWTHSRINKKPEYFKGAGLTRPAYDVNILLLALRKKDLSSGREFLFNSLEGLTIRLYPEVRRIKEKLANLGLKMILMSGSGPAVFAIASSRKEAVSLARKLKKEERSWRIFVTKTI